MLETGGKEKKKNRVLRTSLLRRVVFRPLATEGPLWQQRDLPVLAAKATTTAEATLETWATSEEEVVPEKRDGGRTGEQENGRMRGEWASKRQEQTEQQLCADEADERAVLALTAEKAELRVRSICGQ